MITNGIRNTSLPSSAQDENVGITLKDFQLSNVWKVDEVGKKYWDGTPCHIIDQTTNRKYLNESKGTVAFKCFLLILGTPIVHSIASSVNVAYQITKLVTLSHFWVDIGEEPYIFTTRLENVGKDLLKIVATPFSLIGLQLSAVYGVFVPYDGRKLYASMERARYGSHILAPCFQPSPDHHLFGGDIRSRNAY
ncbi:MAG TPA: hypothetical protein VGZ69_04330 [Candidatus Rhabdochlamydia sp.]|jgi:hypothetical protein|nr:hypothetical protein [Candidatus Rhabdochlamydia sp.]